MKNLYINNINILILKRYENNYILLFIDGYGFFGICFVIVIYIKYNLR